MKLLDVVNGPWAILPDKLAEIDAIYCARLRGEPIDIAAIEARIGRPLANEPRPYEVRDGVAIIPVEGVMARRANLLSRISGGVSTELAARDIRAAAAEDGVHSLILAYDSPGGSVDGLQLMIRAIADARAAGKRIVAHAAGQMASAAYWTGSAADEVHAADDVTAFGSIGAVAIHRDYSAAQAQAGVRTTEIVAGKYKRAASSNGPLTDDGRRELQALVDHVYGVFVRDVAAHRHVGIDRVLADMADGRIFLGAQAIGAGLADGIASLDELAERLNRERTKTIRGKARAIAASAAPAGDPPYGSKQGGPMPITREQLQAEAPELIAELRAEGAAGERERIRAVEAQAIPGHEALIAQLKYDGATSGPEAAVQVLAAARRTLAGQARQLADDAPQPAKPAATPAQEAGKTREQYHAEAKALQARKGIPYLEALREVGYAG